MGCECKNREFIYPDVDMTRWESQCSSYIADADNYYTKPQIDELVEEIESAITSGCCITPEEVDNKIESAKTEIENEIPSLSGYATEQWVLDKHYISGVDLSDYALKSEIPTSNTAFTNDAGYLTEHQQLKTINGESLVGEGNIVISGGGVTSGEVETMISAATSGLQVSLSAGTNVQIQDNVISATDTTYTAGDNISISNQNVISTVTKFWCGTEAQWEQISGNTDANTIYLIH